MNSTDIIGYTSSDGYILCPMHALHGRKWDRGNESGKVQPIFVGAEFDSIPTCDACPLGDNEIEEGYVIIDSGDYEDSEEELGYSADYEDSGE